MLNKICRTPLLDLQDAIGLQYRTKSLDSRLSPVKIVSSESSSVKEFTKTIFEQDLLLAKNRGYRLPCNLSTKNPSERLFD